MLQRGTFQTCRFLFFCLEAHSSQKVGSYLGRWPTARRHVPLRPNTLSSSRLLYLGVESDLADVTGDDRPLGLDQRHSKGVVYDRLLHRVHLLGKRQRGGERGDPLVVNLRKSATITTTRVEAPMPTPARLVGHRWGATRSQSTTLSASALEAHRWLEALRAHIVSGEEFEPKQPE